MNDKKICKNCGVELPSNGYCMRCGYNGIDNSDIKNSHEEETLEEWKERQIAKNANTFFYLYIFGLIGITIISFIFGNIGNRLGSSKDKGFTNEEILRLFGLSMIICTPANIMSLYYSIKSKNKKLVFINILLLIFLVFIILLDSLNGRHI